jgi:hypothetical protein
MVNNTPNTGPTPGPNPANQARDLRSELRNILDDQGDYNNLLSDSIRELKKLDSAYGKIQSRIESLDRGSVNIRQINQELFRLKQKEFLEQKKLTDLKAELSRVSQADFDIAQNIVNTSKQSTQNITDQVEREKKMLELLSQQGNQQAIVLYAAEKQVEIAQKQIDLGKSALDNEKQVSKQLGISGNLMQKFATKLGVGEEAYAAMTSEARKLVDQNGKVGGFGSKLKVLQSGFKAGASAIKQSFSDPVAKGALVVAAYKGIEKGLTMVGNAAAKAGNFLAGLSQDSSNLVRGLTSGLSDIARQIPLIGGLLGGFIDGISAVLDLVIGVDNFIIKSGRDLNLNTQEARALNREFQNISFNSGNVFTTSRKLLESQVELSNQLGVVNRLTTEQLETNIMLKDIAGLELETRQQIVEASTITGQTSENVVKSVLAQVEGLKDATGIQLQNKQVLKEAANLGGYLGLQFAKFPANLTKSLVTVKAMGMELKQLDSIADSFLDFESSISKEFEAQLLTGKDINLAKAREAFLNNDLATAASEITRQVGSANDFLKLNRIQAESLASAFGMSRDQMGEMLKRQELLSTLGAKDTDNAQKQLQLGLQKFQNQKALTAAIGEEAYQNLVNASTQEKMASFIEKIKQSIVDFVERSGIIEKIQGFIDYIAKPENIKKILVTVRDTFADIAEVVLAITNGVINAIDAVTLGFGIEEDFERKFEKFSEEAPKRIRSMGGNFESLTVGDNAANSQVKNSQGAAVASPQDNMSMARPTKETINLNANLYVVDSKRENEYRVERVPNLDGKTGL